MIEIILIFFSFFIFLLFFSFPLNIFNYKFYLNNKNVYNLSIFDTTILNVILHLNILLFISFFSINLNIIFFIYLFIGLIFFICYIKNYINFFKKKFLMILFFMIIYYSLSLHIVADPTLSWDAAVHWVYKAQIFNQGGNYALLKDVPYNHYPHIGSFLWGFFWKNSFLDLEYFGRLFFILIFLLLIFSLVEQLSSNFSLLEKILISVFISFLSTNYFLFGGYQEYLIFFLFYAFSRIFLLKNTYRNKIIDHFSISLFLISNLILWTKQEGFFYYFFLNIIFLIHYKKNITSKLIYLLLVLFFLFLQFYLKIHFLGFFKFNESILYKELLENLNIYILLNKIYYILKYLIISIFKYPTILLTILSFIILKFKYDCLKSYKFLHTSIFFFLLMLFGIYIQTKMDIVFLIPVTLNRLVFGMSGFYIFLLIECLNKIKEKK